MTVMPDYYAILARAIVGLEPRDDTRRIIRASAGDHRGRIARKQNPNISAEQALLEVDIRRLESDLAPPATSKRDDRQKRDFTLADELDGMPRSLAELLFDIAYLTAIIAFSGVVYIRGLALVYAHIIGYPVLIGAMAILGRLFVPLSRKVFRKLRV
jgi:hypothetical protein